MLAAALPRFYRLSVRFFAILAFASIVLCFFAYKYVRYRENEIVEEKRKELNTIADLQVSFIVQWKSQWISHGNVFMHDPILRDALVKWDRAASNAILKKTILDWMELQKQNVPFLEVHICSASGEKLLSSLEDKKPFPEPMVPYIHAASVTRAIQLTDLSMIIIERNRSSKHYRSLYAEQQKTKEQIAAQREQLAVTLRSIGDGVISTDNCGRIVLMNHVAEKLTGWTLSEAEGKPLAEVFRIINEITRKPCENPVEKVLTTGFIISLVNHTLLIRRDGRFHP